jgi:catechol 2,3-dioxygenase-like lactoylglutathione lyase family enzyme
MAIDKTKVVQIAVLTRDVKETSAAWCKFLGLEMPEIIKTDGYEKTKAWFRGEPCHGLIYQSVFSFNNIALEIIQPVDGAPSIWRECLDRNGEGLHHIAFAVKDMPSAIGEAESLGFPLIQKGEYTGGRYAYMDAVGSMKLILEFLEDD